MNSIATKTVRDLAVEIPGATRVFENLGIDYCCGGTRSLADACAAVGITLDDVENSLEKANVPHAQFEEPNFLTATLAELIDHIVEKHHVFTKTEMARLRALMDKVHSAHGQNHPELAEIRSIFQSLSSELEPHMMKEERVLFPFIMGMEDAVHKSRPIQVPPFGTVANPVRMMMMEHEDAGALMSQMRRVTSNYTIPPDACISYQTLYQALDAFEKDLHQHIHLENNILFPRAVEMEGGV
jgi:regulator of cell morphogenesis and NO signaling